jgi:hypothetical protein
MARRARALLVTTPESPVVLDSLQRGSVDIWPIQRAAPADLAAEIERGEHDAYLSDLLAAERTQRSAPVVLRAIAARRSLAGLEPVPADPAPRPPRDVQPWKGWGS